MTPAPRHLVTVWDPSRTPDAMEATVRHLLSFARAARGERLGFEHVRVWWGKIQSPNRQQPLPHLDDIVALDELLDTDVVDDAPEVHLYLTDYRSLYVAHVAQVTRDDPRDDEHEWDHVPPGIYPRPVACDCWFELYDIRRLVPDDTRAVVEELKRLRNTRYHDRPVSLYGGMVELPLLATRDDGARWFDRATRELLADGRTWVEFDADTASETGRVGASLRDDVLGETTWMDLDPAARLFVATAEHLFRTHRRDPAFDFGPVVVNLAKAWEVQLAGLLRGVDLGPRVGQVNVDGRMVEVLGERFPGLGALAKALGDDPAFPAALARWYANGEWLARSMPAIVDELARARNAAAHDGATTRAAVEPLRDAHLGIGQLGHLVELARVRPVPGAKRRAR